MNSRKHLILYDTTRYPDPPKRHEHKFDSITKDIKYLIDLFFMEDSHICRNDLICYDIYGNILEENIKLASLGMKKILLFLSSKRHIIYKKKNKIIEQQKEFTFNVVI